MEPNENIPGVTFYVMRSSLKERIGSVVLDATVNDPDLWQEVLTKLNNLRVYTVADLTTAMIEVLQEENKEAKEGHAREVAALREKLERAQQRLSFYEAKERQDKELFEELSKLAGSLSSNCGVDSPHGLQRDRETHAGDVRPPGQGGGVDAER
jgi:hypothetical protein